MIVVKPLNTISFLLFHNQSDDISGAINKLKNKLPYHAGPIIRKEKPYDNLSIKERSKMLREMLVLATILPIKTKTFVYEKKELHFDKRKMVMRLSKDIYSFLDQYRDYFMSFDRIIVYYDKGQQVVEKALLQSFGIIGYPVDFKDDVKADNYRLFQLTDFICSISLIETKMNNHELSKSEAKFFNDPQSFKKYYLKALKKKVLS